MSTSTALEVWAGAESSRLQVGERIVDELDASGHANRDADLDRVAAMGVAAVRYPVLWGRGSPDETDWQWADRRIGSLLDRGIRPVVEFLHHGFGPVGVDPFHRDYPARLADFAGKVVARYPSVREFLPVNEPLVTARFSGLYGHWWPHGRDHATFIRLLLQQILALSAASEAIRAIRPDAVVIVNEDVGATFGTAVTAPAARFDETRRWLAWDLLMGRVQPGHPMWSYLAGVPETTAGLETLALGPQVPDILGVDHYVISDRYLDHRLERYPVTSHGGDGATAYADVEAVRVEGIRTRPFRRAIQETWERYHLPIALTEVHLSGEADDQVAWWREAMAAAREAAAAGVDIRAVTAWAVFGSADWDSLLTRATGVCLAGPASGAATRLTHAITASAAAADQAGSLTDGWWNRTDRLQYRMPTAKTTAR